MGPSQFTKNEKLRIVGSGFILFIPHFIKSRFSEPIHHITTIPVKSEFFWKWDFNQILSSLNRELWHYCWTLKLLWFRFNFQVEKVEGQPASRIKPNKNNTINLLLSNIHFSNLYHVLFHRDPVRTQGPHPRCRVQLVRNTACHV